MVHVTGEISSWVFLRSLLLPVSVLLGSQDNGKVIHINKVHHQPLRVGLAEQVALPCLFLLQPPASLGPNIPPDLPRIKWSKVQSAAGQPEDLSVLVAKDNVVKIAKGYEGRISLPGYPYQRYNATLSLSAVRASDAGLYRCEVVAGIHDEQDLVPLVVTGVVFHYRAASNRYALTFSAAQRACEENSAVIASPAHLQAAFEDGYDNCDAGWLSDHTVRYPITLSRPGCYGDRNSLPGIRSYGKRNGDETYDVYCYTKELRGKVFYASSPGRMTFPMAQKYCLSRGAELATTGQLYLAWKEGLDQCDPGWLADGSVRYPIRTPRKKCGGDEPGVRTAYQHANRTGFPHSGSRFDAYCYKAWLPGKKPLGTATGEVLDPAVRGPVDQEAEGSHDSLMENLLVEHEPDLPPPGPNEPFPKETEEAILSGDARDLPKEPYGTLQKAGTALMDEQLQLVTSSPGGKETEEERRTSPQGPLWGGGRQEGSPTPTDASHRDTSVEQDLLGVVDRAPTDSTNGEVVANEESSAVAGASLEDGFEDTTPAEGVTHPASPTWLHGSTQRLAPKETVSPGPPELLYTQLPLGHPVPSTLAGTSTAHRGHPGLTTGAPAPATTPESTRRSIYTGLNGRYFQQIVEEELVVGEEAEGSATSPTALPVLALAVQKMVDNFVETSVEAQPSPAAVLRGGASYALSNEVEGDQILPSEHRGHPESTFLPPSLFGRDTHGSSHEQPVASGTYSQEAPTHPGHPEASSPVTADGLLWSPETATTTGGAAKDGAPMDISTRGDHLPHVALARDNGDTFSGFGEVLLTVPGSPPEFKRKEVQEEKGSGAASDHFRDGHDSELVSFANGFSDPSFKAQQNLMGSSQEGMGPDVSRATRTEVSLLDVGGEEAILKEDSQLAELRGEAASTLSVTDTLVPTPDPIVPRAAQILSGEVELMASGISQEGEGSSRPGLDPTPTNPMDGSTSTKPQDLSERPGAREEVTQGSDGHLKAGVVNQHRLGEDVVLQTSSTIGSSLLHHLHEGATSGSSAQTISTWPIPTEEQKDATVQSSPGTEPTSHVSTLSPDRPLLPSTSPPSLFPGGGAIGETEDEGSFLPTSPGGFLPLEPDSGSGEDPRNTSATRGGEGPAWNEEANASLMVETDPCDNDPCLHGGPASPAGTSPPVTVREASRGRTAK
ncbi:hypothetical protein JRQ81_008774 [Phrynocephalus forsythii]|uniref:Neurocan n=1 Tax=Phrynocephalus forsythii TaxID=171643 RepID=A0A9Q0XCL1_9SAUR|nr:hypothetical protein JRQ81_008774 [Phrynocephalus forsythii]